MSSIQQGHPFNACSVTQLCFHTGSKKEEPRFLLRRILSLPLHRHRTTRWQSLVGTERSPLCHHEAQCCQRAASGSRWGITSEKWSNEREEMFNELWTGCLGVLQQDVLIWWWRSFLQPEQFLVWDTTFFSSYCQPEEYGSFTLKPISSFSISLLASQTPHKHINTQPPVRVDKAQY